MISLTKAPPDGSMKVAQPMPQPPARLGLGRRRGNRSNHASRSLRQQAFRIAAVVG
jgi:hypothetical protein